MRTVLNVIFLPVMHNILNYVEDKYGHQPHVDSFNKRRHTISSSKSYKSKITVSNNSKVYWYCIYQ